MVIGFIVEFKYQEFNFAFVSAINKKEVVFNKYQYGSSMYRNISSVIKLYRHEGMSLCESI